MTAESPPAPSESGTAAALRMERDRFVALAFCWAEVLLELDREAKVVFASGATQSLIGRPPQTLIGKPVFEAVAEADRTAVKRLLGAQTGPGRFEKPRFGSPVPRARRRGWTAPAIGSRIWTGTCSSRCGEFAIPPSTR